MNLISNDYVQAANGAKAVTIIALLVEYRGVSWR
jgi:hypothetical protein